MLHHALCVGSLPQEREAYRRTSSPARKEQRALHPALSLSASSDGILCPFPARLSVAQHSL